MIVRVKSADKIKDVIWAGATTYHYGFTPQIYRYCGEVWNCDFVGKGQYGEYYMLSNGFKIHSAFLEPVNWDTFEKL